MIFDLAASNNKEAKMKGLKYRVWFAPLTDVDIDNFPMSTNATILTNPLKEGKTWRFFDAKFGSLKPSAAVGDSPAEGKLTVAAIIEGVSKATLSWAYRLAGEQVIVVWERCSDGARFIGGTPCSGGLTFKYSSIGDQDGGISGIAITLEGGECPDPICFYDGELPQEAPTSITGDTLAITKNSRYILTDNATKTTLSNLTGVTDPDVGRIVEIIGAGVAHPTAIESSSPFVLTKGLTFTAKVGNTLFMQISKNGSGYLFTEVSRR